MKKLKERLTQISLALLVVIISFFVALITFIYVAGIVFLKKRDSIDNEVFTYLKRHISSANTEIMEFLSFLGSTYFLIPANILLILYFLFAKKQKWISIEIPVISISSLLLMIILKQLFHRQRPTQPLLHAAQGLSFPSGHALMSFSFYGLLIYLSWNNIENKIAKWIIMISLLLLIFFIGLSRIYLRVHYATDVIAGFSLGLIWLVFSLFILGKLEKIILKEKNLKAE